MEAHVQAKRMPSPLNLCPHLGFDFVWVLSGRVADHDCHIYGIAAKFVLKSPKQHREFFHSVSFPLQMPVMESSAPSFIIKDSPSIGNHNHAPLVATLHPDSSRGSG
jgi:hypothetical protein